MNFKWFKPRYALAILVVAAFILFLWLIIALNTEKKRREEVLFAFASPDRGYIAYVIADMEDSNRSEIFIEDIDGTTRINLTNENIFGRTPVWSPDGKKIVFVGWRRQAGENAVGVEAYQLKESAEDIYIINSDGTGLRNLTPNAVQDFRPIWSPDSNQILFNSGPDINLINIDDLSIQRLADENLDGGIFMWLPDETIIISTSDNTLSLLNIETGALSPLIERWDGYCLSWSPSQTRFAYIARASDEGLDSLYSFDIEKKTSEELFVSNNVLFCPAWAPDGERIAISTSNKLYVVNVDDSDAIEISSIFLPVSLFWSNDGSRVYLVTESNRIQEFEIG